jgi:hypothetical protein
LCHCDIRESNILCFGNEYQLIDYDLSVTAGTSVQFSPGALYDSRGDRLRDVKNDGTVTWTPTDDLEMLVQLLLGLCPR